MKAKILPMTGFSALELKQKSAQKLVTGNEDSKRKLRNLIHRVFAQTDDGKELMQVLIAWTLVRPVAIPSNDTSHAFFREGENNIVRSLLEAIEEAEDE